MKKRLSMVANFLAFNLLFFALYLNFIKEDNNSAVSAHRETPTTLVADKVILQQEAPLQQARASHKAAVQQEVKRTTTSTPLQLSFN